MSRWHAEPMNGRCGRSSYGASAPERVRAGALASSRQAARGLIAGTLVIVYVAVLVASRY